jgi:hypothetical protein
MTYATGTAARTLPQPATTHTGNGGPPGPSDGTRIAIAVAVAFVVGALLARFLDWRTHAHPDD